MRPLAADCLHEEDQRQRLHSARWRRTPGLGTYPETPGRVRWACGASAGRAYGGALTGATGICAGGNGQPAARHLGCGQPRPRAGRGARVKAQWDQGPHCHAACGPSARGWPSGRRRTLRCRPPRPHRRRWRARGTPRLPHFRDS